MIVKMLLIKKKEVRSVRPVKCKVAACLVSYWLSSYKIVTFLSLFHPFVTIMSHNLLVYFMLRLSSTDEKLKIS